MQPNEHPTKPDIKIGDCLATRLAIIIFMVSPLIFTEFVTNAYAFIGISIYFLYLFTSTIFCFLSVSKKHVYSAITSMFDAFLLGALCWLTSSISYGIEAFAILVISLEITKRSNRLSSSLLMAICSGVLCWYFLPQVGIESISNWQGSWQNSVSMGAFVVYSLLILRKQVLVQENTIQKLEGLESLHLELKFKLYQISKYISPTLRKKLSHSREIEAKTVRKKLTIFFSDLVGFSEIAEILDPADLNYVLNSYVTEMSNVAIEYGATIDKFMGDGMMAFFGDPRSNGTKEDAIKCVSMAIEMRRRMQKLRVKWRELGIQADLQIRMGINSGFTTVGNFGSNDRLDYTAVGTEVNLASRLESNAEVDGILISSSTQILIGDKFLTKSRGDIKVKGYIDPIPVFSVTGERGKQTKDLGYANHNTDGFSLYMDLNSVPNYNRKKVHDALVDAAKKLKQHDSNQKNQQ